MSKARPLYLKLEDDLASQTLWHMTYQVDCILDERLVANTYEMRSHNAIDAALEDESSYE